MANTFNFQISLDMRDNQVLLRVDEMNDSFTALDESIKRVKDSVSNAGQGISESISSSSTKINTSISSIEQQVSRTGNLLKGLGKLVAFTQVVQGAQFVVDGLSQMAQPAVDFGQAMADLSSITGIAGEELKQLTRDARRFGVDAGIGATAAAQSYAVLASQIQVDAIGMQGLNILQEKTIILAQAAGMAMADAATALAGTINQFGLAASDAERVINVLAAGSKYGAAEISELSQSFKVVGAVANGAKVSLEETAGALEVLSKNNLKGAEAGTALRNILLKMQTTLGVDLGEVGLSKALADLKPQLEDVTSLSKIFGVENVAAAQFLISHADAVEEMTAKLTGTQTAYEQAEIRTDTWAHKMEVARARVDDFKIGLSNLTGGVMPFAAVLGESLVPLAQLTPLFSAALVGANALRASLARLSAQQTTVAAKSGIVAAAKTVWTAVQWGLNAALTANPIGLVVAAIAGLVAIIVVAYKKSDSFRAQCDRVWEGLKNLWEIVKAKLTPVWERLTAVFEAIKPVLITLGKIWINYILLPIKAVLWAVEGLLSLFGLYDAKAQETVEKNKKLSEEASHAATSFDAQAGAVEDAANQLDAYAQALQNLGLQADPMRIDVGDAWQIIESVRRERDNISKWSVEQLDSKISQLQTALKKLNPTDPIIKQIQNWVKHLQGVRKTVANNLGLEKAMPTVKQVNKDLQTMAGIQNRISELQEKQKNASKERAIDLQKEITLLQEKQKLLKFEIEQRARPRREINKVQAPIARVIPLRDPVKEAREKKRKEEEDYDKKLKDPLAELGKLKLKDPFQPFVEGAKKAKTQIEATQTVMGALGSSFRSLSGLVGEGEQAWISWAASIIDAIAQAIPVIAQLFAAHSAEAAAGASASVSSVPIVGPAMAVAAIASVLGALAAVPKPFAEGGVVYGTTYAMVGEYAGAANNPEVIAPLNKLRDILSDEQGTHAGGEVVFRIKGRNLEGVLNNEKTRRKRV